MRICEECEVTWRKKWTFCHACKCDKFQEMED